MQNSCGPSTVANVLRAYGYETTEEQVYRKVKQATAANEPDPMTGTIEGQLKKCLTAMKVPFEECNAHGPLLALSALHGQIQTGASAILAVDNDSHWLCVLAISGTRFSVVDSADPELNLFYTGEELARRWGNPGDPPTYYWILCRPKPKKRKT
jgi:hypothetical protein